MCTHHYVSRVLIDKKVIFREILRGMLLIVLNFLVSCFLYVYFLFFIFSDSEIPIYLILCMTKHYTSCYKCIIVLCAKHIMVRFVLIW